MEANQNIAAAVAKASLKKKVLLAICVVVALVAVSLTSVLATVAYLTSSAAVSNVFTIGNVGIVMTESKVNPDGTVVEGAARVDTNTYHLVPNTTYVKDPTITVNTGSEHSYLFVLVRNDIQAIEDDCGTAGHETIAQQLAAKGWAKYTKASTGWVYVYVGAGNVPAEDAERTAVAAEFEFTAQAVTAGDYKLFDHFSVDEDADVSRYGAAKITLTAIAIQKAGFEDLSKAWAAVLESYPYIATGQSN